MCGALLGMGLLTGGEHKELVRSRSEEEAGKQEGASYNWELPRDVVEEAVLHPWSA